MDPLTEFLHNLHGCEYCDDLNAYRDFLRGISTLPSNVYRLPGTGEGAVWSPVVIDRYLLGMYR